MNTFINAEKRKEAMLARFNAAHQIAGKKWKDLVISVDPSYNTKAGADALNRITGDRKRGTRISLQKLEEITIALERAVGINPVEK